MKLMNTSQVAEKLGVSVRRVRALIAEGSLEAHQIGREYAIEESALASVTVYRKPGRPPKLAEADNAVKAEKRAAEKGAQASLFELPATTAKPQANAKKTGAKKASKKTSPKK